MIINLIHHPRFPVKKHRINTDKFSVFNKLDEKTNSSEPIFLNKNDMDKIDLFLSIFYFSSKKIL